MHHKMKRNLRDAERKPFYSVDEAHQKAGGDEVVSRGLFYKSIARSEIPSVRLGKRILIPVEAFDEWMKGNGLKETA
jgi:excisionase family DNA binding protein